jgi:hypothetical protein
MLNEVTQLLFLLLLEIYGLAIGKEEVELLMVAWMRSASPARTALMIGLKQIIIVRMIILLHFQIVLLVHQVAQVH